MLNVSISNKNTYKLEYILYVAYNESDELQSTNVLTQLKH